MARAEAPAISGPFPHGIVFDETFDHWYQPEWSPDSKGFACIYRKNRELRLFVVPDAKSGASWKHFIQPIDDKGLGWDSKLLDWAPDNNRLAIAKREEVGGNLEIRVLRANDGRLLQQMQFDLPQYCRINAELAIRIQWSSNPDLLAVSCRADDKFTPRGYLRVIDLKKQRSTVTCDYVDNFQWAKEDVIARMFPSSEKFALIKTIFTNGNVAPLPISAKHGVVSTWEFSNDCLYVLQKRGKFMEEDSFRWSENVGLCDQHPQDVLRLSVFHKPGKSWELAWAREFKPGLSNSSVMETLLPSPDGNWSGVTVSYSKSGVWHSRSWLVSRSEVIKPEVIAGKKNLSEEQDTVRWEDNNVLVSENISPDSEGLRFVWFSTETKRRTFYRTRALGRFNFSVSPDRKYAALSVPNREDDTKQTLVMSPNDSQFALE